ncbi:MAG: Cytidylate kinase [Chlamydiae bacterium]|nr:Cytidylate kinase [Chlamydiota bacterium]
MLITIDGPAGTGKSTIAQKLSELFELPYYNTGTMYRALTYKILRDKINVDDEEERKKMVSNTSIQLDNMRCFLDKKDVTKHLRKKEVDDAVSKVSAFKEVRTFIVELQRAYGKHNGIFEGRDMGTTVFPDADLKIFLNASPKIRAQRRFLEMQTKESKLEDIEKELQERDHLDTTRKISPLRQPDDAFFIDTSYLSIAEVVEKIEYYYELIEKQKQKLNKFFVFSRFLFKVLFKIFYRYKVYGKEHLSKGAAIIASHHASFIDPIFVGVASNDPIHYFARKSLFKNKLLKFIFKRIYTYPIGRGGLDLKAIKVAQNFLRDGKKIVLFPEGTRSPDGTIQPLREGAALIAIRTHTKIIPTHLIGTFKVWPKSKKFPRLFGKIVCIFGSPLDPKLWGMYGRKEAQIQITKALADKLHELDEWYKKGAKGSPP